MGEFSSSGRLKVAVRDFGPIRRAAIDLRPFTVFVGPSNTGKSYLACLIYALHRFFGAKLGRFWPRLEISHASRFSAGAYQKDIPKPDLEGFFVWLDRQMSDTRDTFAPLPSYVSDLIRPYFRISSQDSIDLEREIIRCIGTAEIKDLISHNSSDGSQILVQKYGLDSKQNPNPFSYDLSVHGSGNKMHSEIPNENLFHVDPREFELIRALQHDLDSSSGTSKSPSAIDRLMLASLIEMATPDVIGPLNSSAFYLPADRTGVMHAHQVVVSALVENATIAGLRPLRKMPVLSGILADFLKELIALGSRKTRPSKSLDDLALQIEEQVLQGEVKIQESDSGYPEFAYRPTGWLKDLPLSNASSMVSELAPIILYLKHIVRPGSVLIVEEPESHLHPEKQAHLVRELVRVVEAGIRIVITTHSETILEQLGNLIRLSMLPADQRSSIAKDRTAITAGNVGVWLFKKLPDSQCSTVEEAELDPETGLFCVGYESVNEALYNEGARIFNRLQELKSWSN